MQIPSQLFQISLQYKRLNLRFVSGISKLRASLIQNCSKGKKLTKKMKKKNLLMTAVAIFGFA